MSASRVSRKILQRLPAICGFVLAADSVALGQPVHNLTRGTDHATIQAAIDAAVAGDEIEADPGI